MYELYAQDLSEFCYFIDLTLYGPSTSIHDPDATPKSGTNSLSFSCTESGYHLLRVTLASSYPEQGVEYILALCSRPAELFAARLTLEVINPRIEEANGFRSPIVVTCDDQTIQNYRQTYADPDIFL